MEYDLEIERIVAEIKKLKKKKPLVLLQFPDGMKKHATEVVDLLEEKTKAEFIIWLGTCFGACDSPILGKLEKKIDLVISFGHSELKK